MKKGIMKKGKRTVSILISLIMVIGLFTGNLHSLESKEENNNLIFSDIPDNWSAIAIEKAVANGLLIGSNGKIMPDLNLTRAQMATIISRAFGASVRDDLKGFSDIKATDWFFDGMAKAYQMDVIKGYNGMLNPNNPITRQEVFAILARAFKLQPASSIYKEFLDANEISDWARGEVYAIANGGYIQGSNGKLNPKGLITRAEFAKVFDNMLKQYIQSEGIYTAVENGNIIINTPNVTLKDLTVKGDLIIGDGVGDGEVYIDNVNITGRLVVRGGGKDSIIIRGYSNVSNIIIARIDGVVSIKVEGDANVEVIYIDDGSDDVNLEGVIGSVEVNAPNIEVTASNAQIQTMNVLSEASRIVVDENSRIETLNINESAGSARIEVQGIVSVITTRAEGTGIRGVGTVSKVEVKEGGKGTSIETPKTQIVVDEGVTGVTGIGKTPIPPGSSSTNNESGAGNTVRTTPSSGSGSGSNPGNGGSQTKESDFEFDSKTGTIIWYKGNDGVVVIPATIGGVKVEAIGSFAFNYNQNLTSIIIPDNVNIIGDNPFAYCNNLIEINVGESNNTYISIDQIIYNKDMTILIAYPGGISKTSFEIPANVTSIGKYSFAGVSALENIIIPDTVTSIGGGAFYYCTGLKSIQLSNNVSEIKDYTFLGCESLESLELPEKITSIGQYQFGGCESLKAINVSILNTAYLSENGVLYNKDKTELIKYPAAKSGTSFEIPNSVTAIGITAFLDCSSLTDIEIPNSVTTIGSQAFYGCTGLASIPIPNTVAIIGTSAFSSCENLTSITIPKDVKKLDQGVFVDCTSLEEVLFEESSQLTEIGYNAFGNCESLKSIDLPSEVKTIVEKAFSGCTGLESITISNKVTEIYPNAFENCTSFTSITIPNSMKYIYGRAFSGCTNLNSITIGEGVTLINNLFGDNKNDFKDAYTIGGAGTYTKASDGIWTKHDIPKVAIPVISLSKTNAVNREVGVTFTVGLVEGVSFYYTLDGTTPTSTSIKYEGQVTLTAPEQDTEANITIKVLGVKAGSIDSEIATATVKYATLKIYGIAIDNVVTLLEDNTNVDEEDNTWIIDVTKGTVDTSIDENDLMITGLPTSLAATAAAGDNNTIVITVSGGTQEEIQKTITVDIIVKETAITQIGALASDQIEVRIEPSSLFAGGDGTSNYPYQVATAQQLDNVRNFIEQEDIYFIQTADIDLSSYANWIPIGSDSNNKFSGFYNGDNFAIDHLTIDDSTLSCIGMFGYVNKSSTLENIKLTKYLL